MDQNLKRLLQYFSSLYPSCTLKHYSYTTPGNILPKNDKNFILNYIKNTTVTSRFYLVNQLFPTVEKQQE